MDMSTFVPYKLIRMNKAIGTSDIETHSDYDVTITDNFGRAKNVVLKLSKIDSEWCKLRMNGDRYAKLDGGKCSPISPEEYEKLSNKGE